MNSMLLLLSLVLDGQNPKDVGSSNGDVPL